MKNNFTFIRKLYLAALFPNIIAVLGGTVNVFFDGILVGRKIGEVGLSAVNQCLPVYLVLCALGALVASGAAHLSAVAFGANDKNEGRRIFKVALTVAAVSSIAVCVVGLLLSVPLSRLLATADSAEFVLAYLRITLLGGVFKVLLYLPYFYLRLEGRNKRSMAAMLTMTTLNVALDFIFLFVLDFGIAGAAWASVIATAVASVLGFVFLFTSRGNFRMSRPVLPKKGDLRHISRFGAQMALNNVLSAVKILMLGKILVFVNIPAPIAVFAIVNNVSEFFMCIQNGVPQTSGAMTGILVGERDTVSVKKLLGMELMAGTVLSAGAAALLCVFSDSVGALFGSGSDAGAAVICFAVSLVPGTLNNVMSYYYNETGRVGIANTIIVCRGCVIAVALCAAFATLGNLVWLFYPVSEIVTMLVFLAVSVVLRRKSKLSKFYLLDESFEKSGKATSFSVDCAAESICGASERIRAFCDENGFSSKTTMTVSLAIEEILSIVSAKSLAGCGHMDVRVLSSEGGGIVRIRSGGKRYNPLDACDESDDYMGVRMIEKMAKKIEYQSALGVNTLVIFV